jgi:hypothetical protein
MEIGSPRRGQNVGHARVAGSKLRTAAFAVGHPTVTDRLSLTATVGMLLK